jgi:hypothetical protein
MRPWFRGLWLLLRNLHRLRLQDERLAYYQGGGWRSTRALEVDCGPHREFADHTGTRNAKPITAARDVSPAEGQNPPDPSPTEGESDGN